MTLQDKLRAAAEHPDNWDVLALLRDAASELDFKERANLIYADAINTARRKLHEVLDGL